LALLRRFSTSRGQRSRLRSHKPDCSRTAEWVWTTPYTNTYSSRSWDQRSRSYQGHMCTKSPEY